MKGRTSCSWRFVRALSLSTALPDWATATRAEKLALSASGSSLSVSNPTPFYLTVSRISRDGGKALNSKTVMLAPQSSQTVALSSAVSRGETLTINNINDYGADVAVKVAVK
jgi:chaperone protein EcpD